MRLTPYLLVAAVPLLAACPPIRPPEPPPPAPLAAVLDQRVPGWLAQYGVPSIAIAYVKDGSLGWVRVYGEQAPGVPAAGYTLYNVASLTKPVFAELVVRLAAAGKLSLDESMARYWVDPDVAADPRHRALTPRLALAHRGGFTNWRRETNGKLQFQFDPGTSFRYSGEGYEYAARFIERKLGGSLDSLALEYVFRPFGMFSTQFAPRDGLRYRTAMPKGPEGKFGEPSVSEQGNAADDIYTTVGDYAAFIAGVMNRTGLPASYANQRDSIHSLGVADGAHCDPKKVARCPSPFGYGLGWSIMHYPDGPVLWHTGADWGEKAMAFYLPKRREGLVLLTNGANGFEPMIEIVPILFPGTDFADFIAAAKR